MVTVEMEPAGGGAPISVDVFIDHVLHRIEAESWRTTWKLSPDFAEDYWLVGTVGRSEIGQTTMLGF